MKTSVKQFFAIILSLALVFSLAACGEKDSDDEDYGSGKKPNADLLGDVSPEKSPMEYLTAASEATMEDLAERYSGSPLAALADLDLSSGTATFDLSVSEGGDSVAIGGTAGFDCDAAQLLLDAYINYNGQQIDASLYADPDYIGVSVPDLLGDGTYYGFAPHDLYDQVSGSIFSSFIEASDMEVFRQLDEMMGSLSGFDMSFITEYERDVRRISEDLMDTLKLEAREGAVRVDGERVDGWIFTSSIDADDIADVYTSLMDAVLDNSVWDSLMELATAVGADPGELDLNEARAQLSEVAGQIRSSGFKCGIEYQTADGKLVRSILTPSGAELQDGITKTTDFYDDGAVTVTAENGGEQVSLTSRVTSGRGSYNHTLSIEADGDSIALVTDWQDNKLDVSLSGNGETFLRLTGDLAVSRDGFYFENASLMANDGYETVELPFSLSFTSGGRVTAPADLNNIFTMDQSDLMGLLYVIGTLTENM